MTMSEKEPTKEEEVVLPSAPPLEVPEFNPSIPEHLLKDTNDRERFVLERISVLIQQNKWQMEMLKRYQELRNENKAKFEELFGHKLHNQIAEAKELGARKWKRYLFALVALVAYPLYIASVGELGLLRFVKLFY